MLLLQETKDAVTYELGFIVQCSWQTVGSTPLTSVIMSGFILRLRVRVCVCVRAAAAGTLCGHEVSEVPDEFAHDVLLPLLVESAVVALQYFFLVLLREHHGRILEGG